MAVEKTAAPQEQEAQWYVVHAYSGHEEKVKKNLEKRIESMDMQDKILQVLVPMEDEIEIKDGKRRHVQKRIFPGYILVRMVMSNESWFVVRNTPGVTSFVGSADIMKRMRAGETADLVILQASSVDELVQLGKVVPGSRVDLARRVVAGGGLDARAIRRLACAVPLKIAAAGKRMLRKNFAGIGARR